MKETITVFTGEVKTTNQTVDLKSSPIGSCVVVVLFDETSKVSGMAHIMLPGKAPEKEDIIFGKYAANAIGELIRQLTDYGVQKEQLKAVVVGGGNVLKRENDTIGIDNLESVGQLLEELKIMVVASSVKGTDRKSVRVDVDQGVIFFTKGDEPEKEIYRVLKKPQMLISSK